LCCVRLIVLSTRAPPLLPCVHLPFFVNDPTPTVIHTLSLHDALPIYRVEEVLNAAVDDGNYQPLTHLLRVLSDPYAHAEEQKPRSEEHTSELQSRFDLVCRLLLEKKISVPVRCVCYVALFTRAHRLSP